MSRTSVRWIVRIALLASALVAPATASAQFETPNRAFHDQTTFPLDGRHRDVPCESCHLRGVYKGTPSKCFDCHWTRRQDDRYRLQLGSQCEQCHRTTSWTSVRWNHGAMTGMLLNAAHQGLSCASCHKNNRFTQAQANCYSCHRADYERTTAPNHAAAGFPTTCENCHRPGDASFAGAAVDHNAVFPLVGRHATLTCESCHRNNVFAGTPRDCVGCHRPLYDRTTSPSHVAAGFPTTCDSCHRATDSSWQQGTFDHRFPITSGPHRTSCTTCHQNSGSFQAFTCLVCHEHDRTQMDSKHRGIGGYRYDSVACYSCHPSGRN